jgi:hypothetical protein
VENSVETLENPKIEGGNPLRTVENPVETVDNFCTSL